MPLLPGPAVAPTPPTTPLRDPFSDADRLLSFVTLAKHCSRVQSSRSSSRTKLGSSRCTGADEDDMGLALLPDTYETDNDLPGDLGAGLDGPTVVTFR